MRPAEDEDWEKAASRSTTRLMLGVLALAVGLGAAYWKMNQGQFPTERGLRDRAPSSSHGASPYPTCTGYKLKNAFMTTCKAATALDDYTVGARADRFCRCIVENLADEGWHTVQKNLTSADCSPSGGVMFALFRQEWVQYECNHYRRD